MSRAVNSPRDAHCDDLLVRRASRPKGNEPGSDPRNRPMMGALPCRCLGSGPPEGPRGSGAAGPLTGPQAALRVDPAVVQQKRPMDCVLLIGSRRRWLTRSEWENGL